jgi:hypothetical protein
MARFQPQSLTTAVVNVQESNSRLIECDFLAYPLIA